MESSFVKVRNYLVELNANIVLENEEDGLLIINREEDGISNLVIGCADPLLIMEQYLFDLNNDSAEALKSLLIKNRDIVHGAFALDETGKKVIFRDTLQIENLDLNEIEASINSLCLLLSEYSEEILKFSSN
ncbi:MAG: YbjN domain-containing protein [Bacteroidales bacterium]|nr:YbjN domain-containing protein [Bacteroidales bacterium]